MKALKKENTNHTYPVCRWNVAEKRGKGGGEKKTTAIFNCRNKMTDLLKNIPLWIHLDNKINCLFLKKKKKMKNVENKNTMNNRVRISCSAVIKSLSSAPSRCVRSTEENNVETVCSCVCMCVLERKKKQKGEGGEKRAKNRNLRRHPRFCLALGRREVRRSSLRGGAGRPCCLEGTLETWCCPLTPCCPRACTRGVQRCCWEIK